MFNKEKIIEYLKRLEERRTNLSSIFDKLDEIIGCSVEGPLSDETWKAIDLSIEVLSEAIGMYPDDLYWFVYDNDFGNKGYSVEVDGKEYKIDSIESYANYVIEIRENE